MPTKEELESLRRELEKKVFTLIDDHKPYEETTLTLARKIIDTIRAFDADHPVVFIEGIIEE